MAKITYPPTPWEDKQVAYLLPDLRFVYNASLRKWVPVTPGFTKEEDLVTTFGTASVIEVNQKLRDLDSDLDFVGRIWKTIGRPENPAQNDIWIDQFLRLFTYNAINDTWIEINYLVKT